MDNRMDTITSGALKGVNRINAIRSVRRHYGATLHQAGYVVDQLLAGQTAQVVRRIGHSRDDAAADLNPIGIQIM